jgi:uncharacterized surface protein with fasciclin (FAS1) repeats
MNSFVFLRSFFFLFAFGALVACDSDNNSSSPPAPEEPVADPPAPELGSIVDVARDAGSFSTLLTALEAAGLDATLADEDSNFTVFAPTDDAFEALPEGTLDTLLADTDLLTDVLLYHVITDSVVGSDTALSLAGTTTTMANEAKLAITVRGDALYLNESLVIDTDIEASNGVIHVIDAVLTPTVIGEPEGSIVDLALASPDLTTLVTALQAADLVGTLADEDALFTVFAPTDEAFAALGEDAIAALLADTEALTDVLLYHVVGGAAVDSIDATALYGQMVTMVNEADVAIDIRDGELYINESKVIIKDIPATNGIIHVIDAVLLPASEEDTAPTGSIVDIALADPQFSTLVTALEAADLVSTLADETAVFTVFAPTDDAFALLGTDTVNSLLADVPTLTNILTYHVIGDQAVDSATAISLDGSDVEMLNGDTVSVSVQDSTLYINDSAVIAADVIATNGVIHVIDAVLTPPES